MATLLRVPEVAAGATEVVVSEWLVDEGADVTNGAAVVALETEKAIVEVMAEAGGVLLRQLVDAGSTIAVGAPLVLVGTRSDVGADVDALLVELGVQDKAADPTAAQAVPEPQPQPAPATTHNGKRIFATPLSRRLLAEAGIGLDEVTGTGPNGRITKKDVEQATAGRSQPVEEAPSPAPAPAAEAPAATPPRTTPRSSSDTAGYTEIEHSRLRRAVAARLTTSKQTVPHFYVKRSVRIDPLLALRAQLNDVSQQRISVNDLVIRAVGAAHVEVPEANAIWTDDAMRRYDSVDVGVAIASERGLVTPVVRGVETTTPSGIAKRVRDFVEAANAGKLAQRDLEGGSITVTNLGMHGVEEFAAIINPPQSAILAVGAGIQQPVVVAGALEVATVMNLVLSVDHRAIDGALAARWMAALVAILEQPLRLLA
jgi:pyruvate dehydrogenase E2 component (dihydrolipoamide acetyltransferase)